MASWRTVVLGRFPVRVRDRGPHGPGPAAEGENGFEPGAARP
jgi:hypothetical protein